jgi:hypothetical protein
MPKFSSIWKIKILKPNAIFFCWLSRKMGVFESLFPCQIRCRGFWEMGVLIHASYSEAQASPLPFVSQFDAGNDIISTANLGRVLKFMNVFFLLLGGESAAAFSACVHIHKNGSVAIQQQPSCRSSISFI